jgi:hypothetical protein
MAEQEARAAETARVFAEVRDFPIYISHIDDNTRMPFAPWRVWDGVTALIGTGSTLWATYHWLNSGSAAVIFFVGAAVTVGATVLARQVPINRPSLGYRVLWLVMCVFGTQRHTSARVRR